MKVKIKNTKTIIEVIPKFDRGKLEYCDLASETYYAWEDLESCPVISELETAHSAEIKIGITPTVSATMRTKKSPQS